MLVIVLYLSSFEQKRRFTFESPEAMIASTQRIKQYELNLTVLSEESDYCKNKENLLIGIATKAAKTCRNPHCLFKLEKVYDPYLKHTFFPQNYSSLVNQKQSVLRFFLKCFYHEALVQHKTKQRMIDYIQFCLSDVADFSSHCLLLAELEHESLTLFERIKVQKLKLILKEQSDTFNRLVGSSHLEMNQILKAEDTFESIQNDIHQYCDESIDIWKGTFWKNIDLFSLKLKMKDHFSLFESMNAKWSDISKVVKHNKYWMFSFLNYALFIKNQKMKKSTLNLTDQSSPGNEEEIDEEAPLFQGKRTHQINEETFFSSNTTFFQCYLQKGELQFLKVSKSFENITGYTLAEVKDTPLDVILPENLRLHHRETVLEHLESGYTSDEKMYSPKNSVFIDKYKSEIPAIVFYKLYVSLAVQQPLLSFVCLLKNKKKLSSNNDRTEREQRKSARLPDCEDEEFSLKPTCNIFIKEDNLSPAKKITEINRTKWVLRITSSLLILILAILVVFLQKSTSHSEEHTITQVNICNLYNLGFSLGKFYLSFVDEDKSSTRNKITSVTQQINSYKNDPITIKAIFDPTINNPVEYGPSEMNSINEGITYSSVDIFYLMFSSITTLATFPNNFTGHDFAMFHSYIVPAYDTVMETSKHAIHSKVEENFSKEQQYQLTILLSLTTLTILVFIYVYYQINSYQRKMEKMLQIIAQFNRAQINKIIRYWQKLTRYFEKIQKTKLKNNLGTLILFRKTEKSIEQDTIEETHDQIAPLNQQHKNISVSNQREKKKNVIIALLFFLTFTGLFVALSLKTFQENQNIEQFHLEGDYLIEHYPITSIIAYSFFKKFFAYSHPEYPFDPQLFESHLSTLKLFLEQPPLQSPDPSTKYFEKQWNYLFGNPCTYNSEILVQKEVPMNFCLETADHSLTNGIISYLRAIEPIVDGYLKGKFKITKSQIQQYMRGFIIIGFYLADAIEEWKIEMIAKLLTFIENYTLWTVLLCLLLLLLHIIVFQLILLPSLKNDHIFMQQVFMAYVPRSILEKQKIIKHEFFQTGILQM